MNKLNEKIMFLSYFCNISCMNRIFIIIFALVLILSPVGLNAQDKGKSDKTFDKESFVIKRSAFITAELSLTPEEAAAFMPLCEELQQKKYEAGFKCRKLSREIKSKKNPTDSECAEVINECLGVGIKEAMLEKEYYEKFKKVLPAGKLCKYRDAERKFAREFMKSDRENDRKNKER
ncbi:MAG: hypothetical protein LBS04_00235 [Tannerellaceae bacterium]|jgi:hypothetical protein|nr:hypothetical protein [Tannerellaceae bacterium]